ncbi:DNA-binding HxlR family transcriptional regulator [Bradyrhizobium sp. LM4.3]
MDFFGAAPIVFPKMEETTWPRKVQSRTRRGACPVAAFQKMISGKYKLRIVWDLKDGPRRYGEIRSGLLRGTEGSAEITPRVLSRELKALTESGLIDRKDFGEVPPKVEYRLTRKGKSFVPVVAAIRDWGDRNLSELAALADAAE